jgi:hypothetical protein
MKLKEILAILGVAAATTAFTVGLLGPGRVGATDKPEGIKPTIAQPKLTTQECVFALKTDKPAYEAGEMPVLQIEATNPTDKPAEATVWISMSSSSPRLAVSRVMVLPKPLWTGKCLVDLKPGETKTVELATKTKLSAGESFTITMSDKDLTVLAQAFSVQGRALQSQAANQTVPLTQLVP